MLQNFHSAHSYSFEGEQVTLVQVSKDGRVLALMSEGESFGETVLYHERAKRTATIITRSYGQLFMLSKNSVSTALATSPEAHRKLRERARDLYREHMAESGDNDTVSNPVFGTIDGTTRKSSFGGQHGTTLDLDGVRRSVERMETASAAKLAEELATIKTLLLQLGKAPDDDRSAFDEGSETEEYLFPETDVHAGNPTAAKPTRQRSIIKQNSARLTQSMSKKQVFFE